MLNYKVEHLDSMKELKNNYNNEVIKTIPKHIQYRGLPKDYKTSVGTYATVLIGGVKSGHVIKFIFNNYVLLAYATPKKVFIDGAIVMTDRLFSKINNNNFSMCGALTSTGTFKLVINSPKRNTENKEVLSRTRKMLNNSVIVNKRFRVCLDCVNSVDEIINICNLFASKVKYISNFITNHEFVVDKFSCFGLIPYEEPITCLANEDDIADETGADETVVTQPEKSAEAVVEQTQDEPVEVEEPVDVVVPKMVQDFPLVPEVKTVKDFEGVLNDLGISDEILTRYKKLLQKEEQKPTLNDRLNKLWKNVIKPIKTIKRFVKYIKDFKDV